jgi:hypothetical protein
MRTTFPLGMVQMILAAVCERLEFCANNTTLKRTQQPTLNPLWTLTLTLDTSNDFDG